MDGKEGAERKLRASPPRRHRRTGGKRRGEFPCGKRSFKNGEYPAVIAHAVNHQRSSVFQGEFRLRTERGILRAARPS